MILGLLLCIGLGVQAQEEFGIASYYADAFHGRKTASGALYHKDKLTAAHKDLPFGTMIKVTRLDNKQSVKVKVNDRGPYIKGRIVDLSKAAAKKLDLITDGKARVKIEVISRGAENLVAATVPVPDLSDLKSDDKKSSDDNLGNIENPVPTEFSTKSPSRIVPDKKEEVTPKAVPAKPTNVKPKAAPAPDLKVKGPAKPEEKSVQVASLTQYENVMKQVAELQEKWFNNILVSVEPGKNNTPVYKLILGPFPDRATANSYEKDLKKKKKIDGFVVDLSKLKH